jgi:hypothetical protein
MGNHALHNLDKSLLLDGAFFPPPEPGHEPPVIHSMNPKSILTGLAQEAYHFSRA